MDVTRLLRLGKATALGTLGAAMMPANRVKGRGLPRAVVLSVGGANSTEGPLSQTLRRMGFDVTIAARAYPSRGARYASRWMRVDVEDDVERLVQLCEQVDPVVVCSDHRNFLLPAKAVVLERLGLRTFGHDGPRTSNDKIAFRQALDDAAAPNLAWSPLDTAVPEDLRYPVVVKPARGTGSRGVRKVDSLAEFEEARADRRSDASEWVVEEYVQGRQFDVEGVVRDGQLFPLSVTEEHYEEVDGHFPTGWYVFAPPISSDLEAALISTTESVLMACGVQSGAFHCELRVADADNTRIVPLDYSNRYGYPHLVSASAGVDFLETYVRTLMDDQFPAINPAGKTVYQRYLADMEERSRVRSLVEQVPEKVLSVQLTPSVVGDVQRYGNVCLITDSFEELRALLQRYDVEPPSLSKMYASASAEGS